MSEHRELLQIVRSVRRRWRLRRLIGGVAGFVSLAVLLVVVAGWAVDTARFAPAMVTAVRFAAWLIFALAAVRFLLPPLLRRVSDERVALYLEEHEPVLGGRLSSALELGRKSGARGPGPSPALVRRLVRSAVEECRAIDSGRRVERAALWRSSALLAGASALAAGFFFLGPAFLAHTTPLLLDPFEKAEVRNPYRITVEPGDTAVARGSDLEIAARLVNFDAERVDLLVRPAGGDGEWESWSMLREDVSGEGVSGGDDGIRFSLIVFDLQEPTEYRVEASGVRSVIHRIEVMELPHVAEVRAIWRFPAYTGLLPVERRGGDVAALVGTEVDLEITTTLPVPGGAIEIEVEDSTGKQILELAFDADGPGPGSTLRGSFTVGERPAVWRVLLDGPDGRRLLGSADFFIDPLPDQPPTVAFARPGRDLQVSSLEEVAVEVQAADDHGVGRVDFHFTVNGGEEESVAVFAGGAGSTREEFAGIHTFFLEEFGLEPGDLVAYWAQARDGLGQEAVSDIYFLEIRPFERDVRQADSGGGGGMGMSGDELSGQQRMIVSATFKLARGLAGAGDPMEEDLATIALSQGRLREQTLGVAGQLAMAGGGNSPLAVAAQALGEAAGEMTAAEEALGEERPAEALLPEQRALRLLQRAEGAFREVRISQGQPGAGGGQGEMSEELSQLLEEEMDRLRQQYESVSRGIERGVDQEVDEVLERLRELARRQQQENERRRARARQAGDARAGASGEAQRRLAEELEEEARKLERLARQQSRPDLEQIARRLRSAAEEMRRAAADQQAGEALGAAALERLRDARRELEREREGRLARDTAAARERLARLRRQQESMIERVGGLDPDSQEALDRLFESKERMGEEVGELEAEIDRLSRGARRDQPEASRRLQEAAAAVRDRQIREKILYSRGVAAERSRAYARNFEEHIAATLGEVGERLEAAAAAIGESRESRLERALETTREAVTGFESLSDRLRAVGGEAADWTSGGAPPPGPLDPRQLGRELDERRLELEGLRGVLEGEEIGVGGLDSILERLRGLSGADPGDPAVLALLEGEIVAGLKELEYDLRRGLGSGGEERLLEVAEDEVPAGYEELVDEYFKALAGEGR